MYRSISEYPPGVSMMAVLMTGKNEEILGNVADKVKEMIVEQGNKKFRIIGPADGNISKINDVYRKVIYLKHKDYEELVKIKNQIEAISEEITEQSKVSIQFDFNPMSGF